MKQKDHSLHTENTVCLIIVEKRFQVTFIAFDDNVLLIVLGYTCSPIVGFEPTTSLCIANTKPDGNSQT